MSGDGNFDQDDAEQVEIEDVLDDLPWENQTAESENSENSYVQSLLERSDLKILQVDRVNRSYEQNGACGLFKLFISRSFLDKMRKWTNQCLKEDGMREANETKFNAYIGLELAMSLLQFNDLDEYWKNNMFQGHKDFKKTMSRDDFMRIRSHLKLRPPEYLYDSATNDPLWHSRSLMEYFMKQIASIAVPIGTSALDENTVRTKARTKAKSYIANKPQPYGIRFYAVVGSKHTYLHSFYDNGSGNTTGISRAQSYTTVFRDLRGPYSKHFDKVGCPVDRNSATALWILQLAHQAKNDTSVDRKRVIFTDNFYTRHTMAKQLN